MGSINRIKSLVLRKRKSFSWTILLTKYSNITLSITKLNLSSNTQGIRYLRVTDIILLICIPTTLLVRQDVNQLFSFPTRIYICWASFTKFDTTRTEGLEVRPEGGDAHLLNFRLVLQLSSSAALTVSKWPFYAAA